MRLADGEIVAIKLLRAAVHDTVAADRLRREAAALGLAWHPNVVEVFDDGHLPDGTSYLVMERLFGESLEARLRRTGPLSPDEALPIALQVCDALGAVHAAGVVHRDLKPSNIFISNIGPRLGRDRRPALAFAAAVRRAGQAARFRSRARRVGRATADDDGRAARNSGLHVARTGAGLEIDGRSDLFALGSVLYECLSGETPPMRSSALWSSAPGGSGQRRHERSTVASPTFGSGSIERAMAPLPATAFPTRGRCAKRLVRLAAQNPGQQQRQLILLEIHRLMSSLLRRTMMYALRGSAERNRRDRTNGCSAISAATRCCTAGGERRLLPRHRQRRGSESSQQDQGVDSAPLEQTARNALGRVPAGQARRSVDR